eukprot:504642_1
MAEERKRNDPIVEIWGANSSDDIWVSKTGTGRDWKQMSGKLKCVSIGSDGTVWGVNSKDLIYHFQDADNSQWDKIEGALKQISCGRDNHIWGVNVNDEIWSWKTGRGWKQIDGALKHISCGGYNSMCSKYSGYPHEICQANFA